MRSLRVKTIFFAAVLGILALAACRLTLFHGVVPVHAASAGLDFSHHAADCCASDLANAAVMDWHDVLMSSPQLHLAPLAFLLPLVFAFMALVAPLQRQLACAQYALGLHRYRGSPHILNPTIALFQRGIVHPKTF